MFERIMRVVKYIPASVCSLAEIENAVHGKKILAWAKARKRRGKERGDERGKARNLINKMKPV